MDSYINERLNSGRSFVNIHTDTHKHTLKSVFCDVILLGSLGSMRHEKCQGEAVVCVHM